MVRNVALNSVPHDTEFYIQVSGHNSLATQNPDVAPLNSRGNLPEYKESISGLLIWLLCYFPPLPSFPTKSFDPAAERQVVTLESVYIWEVFVHAMSSTAAGAAATPSYCNLWSLGLKNSTPHSSGEIICVI